MEKARENLADNYNKLSDMLPMIADGRLPIEDAQQIYNYVFGDMDKYIYEFGMFAQAAAVAIQMQKEKITKLSKEKAELEEDLAHPHLAKHPAVTGLLTSIRDGFMEQVKELSGSHYPDLIEGAVEFFEQNINAEMVLSLEGE